MLQWIEIIMVPSQQEGAINNLSINPFVNNCWINLICIDDSIVLETKLDNVLTTLNSSEIKDTNPTKQLGIDEFWNNSKDVI